ncbi:MAG: hypothetical protein ACLQDF_08760 [Desulfomonilia bacterium]
MSLLAEYALIHDIFDSTSYSCEEVGRVHLQNLKEVLLHEALVRNLCDGLWLEVFKDDHRPWHLRGKELLKKIITQGRLRCSTPYLSSHPSSDHEWCKEALGSHNKMPLNGIITTSTVADLFPDEQIVGSIDKLSSAPWWTARSPSIRLVRSLGEYQKNLNIILQCANSIMFIDPHLDLNKSKYQDFIALLTSMAGRTPKPLIEIHRVCYTGSGRQRQIITESDWQTRFHGVLSGPLNAAGMSVKVFIWDDFHDRYLISNLVGISVPNGFDTSTSRGAMTTWTRLGRIDRDDIQREFDPSTNRHKLRVRFSVP